MGHSWMAVLYAAWRRGLGMLASLMVMTVAAPVWGAQPELKVNSQAVRALIGSSRYENGDILTLRKTIGLFFLEDDASDQADREGFFKLRMSELRLVANILPLMMEDDKSPRFVRKYSGLVIFRDPEDMKIAEFESEIPGTVKIVNSVRSDLREDACRFFFQIDPEVPDDIQVAYIFVGRRYEDPAACLHSGFLKAFGVRPSEDGVPAPADTFLVQLLALRLIDICSDKHEAERVSCALEGAGQLR